MVEKLLAVIVNQLFVIMFNTARQMFGAASDEYIHAKPSILLKTCFIILPSTPLSSKWSLSPRFPIKFLYEFCFSLLRMKRLANIRHLDSVADILQIMKLLLCSFLQPPLTPSFFDLKYLPSQAVRHHCQSFFPP